ncbi:hypothetical protein [Trichlorobacter lovleyi]|uniref:hypothetical protein n=1 Tax=Trichlorobacter lovleyi TaxID=313985 RepID=UPI0023F17D52|nr:hypothetical protein [Trichlorobacter lovleyi]
MSKRRLIILLAMAIMAAGTTLTGCSGSGSTAPSSAASGAKADVTIKAAFPGVAATAAVKSLIPDATQAIYVYAYEINGSYPSAYTLKLTKASPSGTVKLAPGNYYFYAVAYDSTTETSGYPVGNMLAQTSTGGVVQVGSNVVNLTFLNGQWTLVNASDVATPLVLSDGTQLRDIIVGSEYLQQGAAAKAAFDLTKPIGGGGGLLRFRFDNNSSARTYGGMMAQFIGTANELALYGDNYNLTKKCSSYSYLTDSECKFTSGDRMIFVPGSSDMNYSGGSYEGDLLYGYAGALLPTKGITSFTKDGVAYDLASKFTASTVTGGTAMTGTLVEVVATSITETLSTTPVPAATSTKAKTKVLKAQSANTAYTGITATDEGILICSTATTPNSGGWQFYSQPITIGSATCYTSGYLQPAYSVDQATQEVTYTYDSGTYSYGLAPTDSTKLGDYCHQWDYNPASATYNTCIQQKPGVGDIYYPDNFVAKKTATKTTIDYGSFKLNFHGVRTTSGTVYAYPFRAKGNATVSPTPALK